MDNDKILIKQVKIIEQHLSSIDDVGRYDLIQACLGVAFIMLEDVKEPKLASVINTTGMLVHNLIENMESK